ncbi:MAG: hypothetical protein ABSA75_09960 [Candidatus Bathyarchaeia archaeon]|jgi:hypothetical protein
MTESQFVLKCPYCSYTFVPQPPESDRWHSEFSLEKPLMSSSYGDVLEQKIACKNPGCKKAFTIYWYAPMEYFNRM